MNKFINEVSENIFNEAVNFRRKLHNYPELSDNEYNTQQLIIFELEKENIEYKKVANTGICAIIRNGKGLVVATRADLDALPIMEDNELEYKSINKGIMHACGHDIHITVQLMVLKILNQNKNKWSGTFKVFFQPAEETNGGAERMLKEGVNKDIKADALFAFHTAPEIEVGKIGVRYGALHACSATFKYTIYGIGTHGALAYLGVDALLVGTKVVDYLQTIVSRRIDARESVVITVGTFNSGTANNIVSDKTVLTGTMRFLSDEKREFVINLIKEELPKFVSSYGATIDIDIHKGYGTVINNDNMTDFLKENSINILGENNVLNIDKSRLDAEDIGYFLNEINGTYYRLGVRNEKKNYIYDLHSPKFIADENSIKVGIKVQLKSILEFFNKDKNE